MEPSAERPKNRFTGKNKLQFAVWAHHVSSGAAFM